MELSDTWRAHKNAVLQFQLTFHIMQFYP